MKANKAVKPIGIFLGAWIFIKTFLKIFVFTVIFLVVFRPTSRAYMTQAEAQITAISLFLMMILAAGAYTAYQVITRRKKIALFNQLQEEQGKSKENADHGITLPHQADKPSTPPSSVEDSVFKGDFRPADENRQ